jgi:hypothetical protein
MGKPLSEKELIQSMSKFTENLILWSSGEVIKAYKSYKDYFAKRTTGENLTLESIRIIEKQRSQYPTLAVVSNRNRKRNLGENSINFPLEKRGILK